MDQKCTNDIGLYYNKDLDENLALLTQKTEDPKSNKEKLTPPSPLMLVGNTPKKCYKGL